MKFILLGFAIAFTNAMANTLEPISGAGSSAAFPVYRTWAAEYARTGGTAVHYDPIGSSGGVKKIKAREVDFGGSDVVPARDELAEANLVALPTVITGIVPIINVPGVKHEALVLNGQVLADIFLGQITQWDDRAIQALNPGLKLPAILIKVVVRSDGSGTTYNFTDYLDKTSAEWHAKQKVANSIDWPKHFLSGKGSSGMVDVVTRTRGAIGYVDFNYVVERQLTGIRLWNREHRIVSASPNSFRAALSSSAWREKGDFSQTLTQQPGKESWPITMGTFVLLPRVTHHPQRTLAAIRFLTWSFMHGDELANRIHFVRLPDAVQAKAFRVLAEITDIKGQAIGTSVLRDL